MFIDTLQSINKTNHYIMRQDVQSQISLYDGTNYIKELYGEQVYKDGERVYVEFSLLKESDKELFQLEFVSLALNSSEKWYELDLTKDTKIECGSMRVTVIVIGSLFSQLCDGGSLLLSFQIPTSSFPGERQIKIVAKLVKRNTTRMLEEEDREALIGVDEAIFQDVYIVVRNEEEKEVTALQATQITNSAEVVDAEEAQHTNQKENDLKILLIIFPIFVVFVCGIVICTIYRLRSRGQAVQKPKRILSTERALDSENQIQITESMEDGTKDNSQDLKPFPLSKKLNFV